MGAGRLIQGPYEWLEQGNPTVLRFPWHKGHQYCEAGGAAEIRNENLKDLAVLVTCHLGNGCFILAAIRAGGSGSIPTMGVVLRHWMGDAMGRRSGAQSIPVCPCICLRQNQITALVRGQRKPHYGIQGKNSGFLLFVTKESLVIFDRDLREILVKRGEKGQFGGTAPNSLFLSLCAYVLRSSHWCRNPGS